MVSSIIRLYVNLPIQAAPKVDRSRGQSESGIPDAGSGLAFSVARRCCPNGRPFPYRREIAGTDVFTWVN